MPVTKRESLSNLTASIELILEQIDNEDSAADIVEAVDTFTRAYLQAFKEAEGACESDLLVALKVAVELIGDCQRNGCPAGPVAIPSVILDAIKKAEG